MSINSRLLTPILLAGMSLMTLPLSTAVAHTTQISGDIAGTWHIEPNHSPKAGEPAQVWIALTKAGGELVPLDQCDCHLKVYSNSSSPTETPLLEPILQPVTSEQYQAIPGAEVIFPQVGLYELTLNGTPKAGATFKPFELRYSVTVAAGVPATQTSPDLSTNPAPDLEQQGNSASTKAGGWIIGGGVAIALILATLWLTRRNPSNRSGTSQ